MMHPETTPSSLELESGRFVDSYLPALLAHASQLISGEFHQVVRAHGFSVSEWRVMASLANGEAISIGELAHVTLTKQPTLTRLLDRMATRGQVQRVPHESDRRVTLVRITAEGAQTVAYLMGLAREHEERVLEPFGLARADELKKTLRQIVRLHTQTPGQESAAALPQGSSSSATSGA